MNALEKIEVLKKAKEENVKGGFNSPYFLDISYDESEWKPGEIEAIHKKYPWLPEYYIKFIEKYDKLGLSWFTFFGSKETKGNQLEDWLQYWKEQMGDKYFIFGDSAGGESFVFNHQGQVFMFGEEDFEWEHPIKVADTLEEFIGECLLGNRVGEFDSTENNKFYDFLKAQGWCK